MKNIYIIDGGVKGAKVCCPNIGYQEVINVGRYTVKATLFQEGGYAFHVFKGDELKAIISDKEWYISRLDGEGQNLLNRLMKIFG